MIRRPPREVGIPAGWWTAKWVAVYVHNAFGKPIHPETARRYLHQLRVVPKTPRKRSRLA
ncbi:MAG: winged helix-turn-helix domain-containing protein [Candidatus Bipolaricaulia bacterium]